MPPRRRPSAIKPATNVENVKNLVRERLEQIVVQFALSPREREVCELLLYGFTTDEIADRLGVSARTVKFHQTNVLEKLDANSRLDLFRVFFAED